MRHFMFLILFVSLVLSSCTRIDELRYKETRQVEIYRSKRHVAFPGVVQLKTGEMLVVFREGENHVSPDGKILLCRSTDKGKTWSMPDTIVSTYRDCRDPSIVQLRDGLIIVNFFQSRYDTAGKIIGAIGCFVSLSYDNGKTFTAPRMIQIEGYEWTATSDAIIELNDGSLILPVYGGKEGGKSCAAAVISRDGGNNWEEVYTIAQDSENRIYFQEPALIELPDSKLLCILRTAGAGGFLYQTVSTDHGQTWSDVKNTGVQGQAPDLLLTSHGTLICAYRDFWPRGVSIIRSYDWGRSWEQESSLFSADGDCAYPSMVEMDLGIMAVHYTVQRGWENVSGKKSAIGATLFVIEKPKVPVGFAASVSVDRSVHLRWNVVKDAVYYVVYRDTVQGFVPECGYPFKGNAVAVPTASKYVDLLVDEGQTYYYRITTVFGNGELISNTGSQSDPTEAVGVTIR
jgi:hypothetical protein